jgi:FAD/FMN-containing dehydrogenase
MQGAVVHNWFGSITSSPRVVVEVESVDEIIAILKDPERYPTPVRAVGSNHSTTECGVAEGGTLIVTRKMDRIIEIRGDTVTAQAGALYIDVNYELAKRNLQFYVNVELGNLTIGSACCGGTKDASMPGEFGQVASYAIGIKMVTAAGDLIEINESDSERLQVARSSYGLFGIVYEATFRVRPLAALTVHHESFSLDEFAQQLPALKTRGESIMMYINPFLDRVTVEFRSYHRATAARDLTHWQWKIRDWVWSYMAPLYTYYVTKYVPVAGLRDSLYDLYHRMIVLALLLVIRGKNTLPQAQQIHYPAEADNARYTFSIWAFPEENYIAALRRYFEFSKEYFRTKGYRVNLLSVGYRIRADQSSLFSYSFNGDVMTFDPCSTGNDGWDEFLEAYNELCSELNGVPLFNQTAHLTRPQVEKAFGDRIVKFDRYRKEYDPNDRLLNDYFRELIAQPNTDTDSRAVSSGASNVVGC